MSLVSRMISSMRIIGSYCGVCMAVVFVLTVLVNPEYCDAALQCLILPLHRFSPLYSNIGDTLRLQVHSGHLST